MSSTKNPIDELFSEKLKDHKIAPSAAVWNKIEAAQTAPASSGFKPIYLMRAAVVVLFLSLGAVFYFQREKQEIIVEPIITNNVNRGANEGVQSQAITEENPIETSIVENPAINHKIEKTGAEKTIQLAIADEETLMEEAWMNEELAFVNINTKEDQSLKYSIVVQLPEIQSEYGNYNEKRNFKERVTSYASSQFDRVLAGEKLEPPVRREDLQFAINLPKLKRN